LHPAAGVFFDRAPRVEVQLPPLLVILAAVAAPLVGEQTRRCGASAVVLEILAVTVRCVGG
jgi:hypothetical protein